MPEKFKWPCDKRKAHAPHPLKTACSRCYQRGFSSHTGGCDKDVVVEECPGVKVHPATQIGGNYKETRP